MISRGRASGTISFWFLTPVLWPKRFPPPWVWIVVFLPVFAGVRIAVAKEFKALATLGFTVFLFRPALRLRCSFLSLKPTSRQRQHHPWLTGLFWASLMLPILSLIISLVMSVWR